MNKNGLIENLKKNNISFNENSLDLLLSFMKRTLETNEKFNLTAITDDDQFIEKMILDSALALSAYDFQNKSVIDVGTGAGYPGMVLKILEPSMKITLLDSTKKKIDYLSEFAKENCIDINGVSMRSEDYCKKHREEFDVATARAVANLSILLEIITPMLKVGGALVALKGAGFEEEVSSAKTALQKLSLKIESVKELNLPECGEKRAIIVIRKTDKTKLKYPRDYSEIKKQPL